MSPGGPTAAPDAPPASDNAPATPNTVTAFVRPFRFEFCFPCDMVKASHFTPTLMCLIRQRQPQRSVRTLDWHLPALGQKQTSDCRLLMSALPPKADIHCGSRNVCFVPIGDVVIPSRGEYSATMRRRRYTNNWPEAACVDRPERLDWFPEQRDPRTPRFVAPLRPPKHLSRGR